MEIEHLAARQYGVVSRAQARAHLSAKAIECRLRSGRWVRIHPGVYAVHNGPLSWWALAQAGLLGYGRGAVLMGRTAAFVHGIENWEPKVIEVAIPHGRSARLLPGTTFARRRRLHSMRIKRLSVTPPSVTVLDVAALPESTYLDAVSVVARAVQRRRTSVREIVSALSVRRTHPHRRALEVACGVVAIGGESGLEVVVHTEVLRRHGLPEMRLARPDQLDGRRQRRDFESEAFGVILEVDGLEGHGLAEMGKDRRRDRKALGTGRVTARTDWVDVDRNACGLARDLADIFTSRGWKGTPRSCGPNCAIK